MIEKKLISKHNKLSNDFITIPVKSIAIVQLISVPP